MEQVIIKAARVETGYCCACDLLPGWVVSYDGTIDGFKEYVQESIDFYLEGRKEDGIPYDSVFDREYKIVYDFDVPTLLEYYRGIFSFSALQTITGINQKQLFHYASGISSPRPKQVAKIKNGLRELARHIGTRQSASHCIDKTQ